MVAQATGAPMPRGFDPADPALKYELIVANGDVLDPSQKLRGKRDIGIRYGQIAAIAPSIPADRGVQRIDVGGRLVTPGSSICTRTSCPTSAWACRPTSWWGSPARRRRCRRAMPAGTPWGVFRHPALASARTRLFAFVHISSDRAGRAAWPRARC